MPRPRAVAVDSDATLDRPIRAPTAPALLRRPTVRSPAVRPTTSRGLLLGQWACFLSALVALASLAPWATFRVLEAVLP